MRLQSKTAQNIYRIGQTIGRARVSKVGQRFDERLQGLGQIAPQARAFRSAVVGIEKLAPKLAVAYEKRKDIVGELGNIKKAVQDIDVEAGIRGARNLYKIGKEVKEAEYGGDMLDD